MTYPGKLERIRVEFETALRAHFCACEGPASLLDAMGYSLFAGGKRIRPVLLLAAHAAVGPSELDPMPAACALELIHTYSLIHDDLPAMDDDDMRRGRPTCHRRFGEARAVLAGDGLLTEAFGVMARSYATTGDRACIRVIAEIATAAGSAGMVGGQDLDTSATGHRLDRPEIERVHRLKTGALIVASVRCGALLARASRTRLEALSRYAQHVGLAFQVADDVLDVTGTRGDLGKSVGKDAAQGKTTFVSLLGLAAARAHVRELATRALRELRDFDAAADALREIPEYIAARAERGTDGFRTVDSGMCDSAPVQGDTRRWTNP